MLGWQGCRCGRGHAAPPARILRAGAHRRAVERRTDEPRNATPRKNNRHVAKTVKVLAATGHTIFVIIHDFEFVLSCCMGVVRIEGGEVARDDPVKSDEIDSMGQAFYRERRSTSSRCLWDMLPAASSEHPSRAERRTGGRIDPIAARVEETCFERGTSIAELARRVGDGSQETLARPQRGARHEGRLDCQAMRGVGAGDEILRPALFARSSQKRCFPVRFRRPPASSALNQVIGTPMDSDAINLHPSETLARKA